MELNKQPAIHLYWCNSTTYNGLYGCSFIKAVMSKNSFWAINKILHCKISIVISLLNNIFQNIWIPHQEIAIDESIIAFKGKMIGRQHIPTKPHSTGIKIYGMADTKSFIWSFWIYKGKTDIEHNAKPHEIVMDFVKLLLNDKKHLVRLKCCRSKSRMYICSILN